MMLRALLITVVAVAVSTWSGAALADACAPETEHDVTIAPEIECVTFVDEPDCGGGAKITITNDCTVDLIGVERRSSSQNLEPGTPPLQECIEAWQIAKDNNAEPPPCVVEPGGTAVAFVMDGDELEFELDGQALTASVAANPVEDGDSSGCSASGLPASRSSSVALLLAVGMIGILRARRVRRFGGALATGGLVLAMGCGDDTGTGGGGNGQGGDAAQGGNGEGGEGQGGEIGQGGGSCSLTDPCATGTCIFPEGSCTEGDTGVCQDGFTCDGPPSGPVCGCDGEVVEGEHAECELWGDGLPYADAEACGQGTFECGELDCTRHIQVCVVTIGGPKGAQPTYECRGLESGAGSCSHGIADCSCLDLELIGCPDTSCCAADDDHQETITIALP